MQILRIRGFKVHKNWLSIDRQQEVVDAVRDVVRQAPLFRPETRFGKKMSVRMTSAGRYGWVSDRTGYRYAKEHPAGQPWPDIPAIIMDIWSEATGLARRPDCCLINYYDSNARMGMHQDKDEADFSWPVLSISLGDDGLFRIGNRERDGKTESVWLSSGDLVIMGDEARLSYHGIGRIRSGSSRLLPKGGRINLTLRVVD